MNSKNLGIGGLIILAVILGILAFRDNNDSVVTDQATKSRLEVIKDNKRVRVGFAAYAPYVDKHLNTGELSGYSVDVIKEIADQMDIEIDWVETTWSTYIADLKTDKFDILLGPLFVTIPRAMEVDFSNSMGYFSAISALVSKDDNRFTKLEDLNQKGVVISVPQGWVADEYARKYLTDATVKTFKEDNAALTIADIISGNADVALVDGPTAQQYIEKNPNQNIKALFLEDPPVVVPSGFAFKKGDPEWVGFINNSLDTLRTGGVLKNIANKYHLYSYDLDLKYVPQ